MKYVLTREELDELVPKKDLELAQEAIAYMRKLIAFPHCVYYNDDVEDYDWYGCLDCPLSDIRMDSEGNDIKVDFGHELSHTMCDHHRGYPK